MKLKSNSWTMASLLLSLLFFSTCEKNANITSLEQPKEEISSFSFNGTSFSILDGRILINSQEEARILEEAVLLNQEEASQLFNNIPEYISAEQAYLSINGTKLKSEKDFEAFSSIAFFEKLAGDEYLEPVIDNLALRFIANHQRIFQIADRIYEITRDYGISIPADVYFHLSNEEKLNHPEAIIIPIFRKTISRTLMKDNVGRCRGNYENDRRVTGELEETHPFLNSSVTNLLVRTKHFKKGFLGRYYGERADELRHNGDLVVNHNNSTFTFSVNQVRTNEQNFGTLFFFNTGNPTIEAGFADNFAREGGISGNCRCLPGVY
ncbi:MAG: hypothetical protein R2828_25825 [Saprospiraceae bacterium]